MSEDRIHDGSHHPHHKPTCEQCGSSNVDADFHKGYADFTCKDCGHRWTKNFPHPHHKETDGLA